ncbi:MAG: dockerin type I domain-containing protein [Oscillospiraceae bacterium]
MKKFIAGMYVLSMLGAMTSINVNAAEMDNDIVKTISTEKFSDIAETTAENTEDEIISETTEETDIAEETAAETTEKKNRNEFFHGKFGYDFEDEDADIIKDEDDFRDFIIKDENWIKSDKPYCVITVNEAGFDKDGNKIFSHNPDAVINGYDENGEPVFEEKECPKKPRFLGFDENGRKLFSDNEHDRLMMINEDGSITDATAEPVDDEKQLYRAFDVKKGHDILIKYEDDDYYRLHNGDANADGEVDIRDVTAIEQDIVEFAEIPDYMITADIDHDDKIDVKDLGILVKSLIKECEISE